jgi:hypothetical protein
MKRKSQPSRRRGPVSTAAWRRQWEPIFRAAREGRLPNRLGGVLEAMQCQCALRLYRSQMRRATRV